MKTLRPVLIISLLLCSLHAYIGWRLIPEFPAGQMFAVGFLVFSCLIIPAAMLSRFVIRPAWADVLSWVGALMMGLGSSLLVLTFLRDLALGVSYLFSTAAVHAQLAFLSALAVPGLAVLSTAVGLYFARRIPPVLRVDVPLENLPKGLQGFTIAQISDIHVGPTIKRPYLQAIVDIVNDLHPDLIAVTGDMVDGRVRDLGFHVAPIADLVARHGTCFVTGNHEYYSGVQEWVDELRRLGLHVLENRHLVLEHEGERIVIAGVTDYSARNPQSDPQAALQGAPAQAIKILLAHQPRSAFAAVKAGFDLQLSGHTHGGQFWPWNHFVRLQQPFTAGLHRVENLWIYINRGTGYWGPPKRLGTTSEITLIRLMPAGF